MFTLINSNNRPYDADFGPLGLVRVPAMGRIDVKGKLEDIDPNSGGGRMIARGTFRAEEVAKKAAAKPAEKPAPDAPIQPAAPAPAPPAPAAPAPTPTAKSEKDQPAWLKPPAEG